MRRSLVLWIIAVILMGAAIALYLVAPERAERNAAQSAAADLASTVAKANTYFDFGHFARAAETYEEAAAAGMTDGAAWYEYAVSLDESGERDVQVYLLAYQHLNGQNPSHEYMAELELVITEESRVFDYEMAETGELQPGTLVVASGTIARVEWGRVAEGTDTVVVATRPDRWMGHIGHEILSVVPRDRRYPVGEQILIVGWFEDWVEHPDHTGVNRRYPHVRAAGVRRVTP